MELLTAKKAFANFFNKKFANFCPNFAYETNEVSWYANVLLSRVTRFARNNNSLNCELNFLISFKNRNGLLTSYCHERSE